MISMSFAVKYYLIVTFLVSLSLLSTFVVLEGAVYICYK